MDNNHEATEGPPPKDLHRLQRLLYLPWAWSVFYPWLGVSTIGFGAAAIVIAKFNKNAAFHCGTVWAWSLCRANLTRVKVRGRENIEDGQSYVIMSNHQSHFDSLAIYGHWRRQFRWVMKQELRKVVALGKACDDVGHIFIDRSDRDKAIASLVAAQKRLEPGVSVLFFPEGSRSMTGRMGSFKKGGFVMAQQMGLPILPVSISGSYKVLPAKSYSLLPGTITITIHEPIETKSYGDDERERLMADVRRKIASGLPAWERGEVS